MHGVIIWALGIVCRLWRANAKGCRDEGKSEPSITFNPFSSSGWLAAEVSGSGSSSTARRLCFLFWWITPSPPSTHRQAQLSGARSVRAILAVDWLRRSHPRPGCLSAVAPPRSWQAPPGASRVTPGRPLQFVIPWPCRLQLFQSGYPQVGQTEGSTEPRLGGPPQPPLIGSFRAFQSKLVALKSMFLVARPRAFSNPPAAKSLAWEDVRSTVQCSISNPVLFFFSSFLGLFVPVLRLLTFARPPRPSHILWIHF